VTADDLPILGLTQTGKLILGGFFTAHDTHGLHCDWFLSMFLEKGFAVVRNLVAASWMRGWPTMRYPVNPGTSRTPGGS
jgi:hypothetical protein